jgi:hypothetical protein
MATLEDHGLEEVYITQIALKMNGKEIPPGHLIRKPELPTGEQHFQSGAVSKAIIPIAMISKPLGEASAPNGEASEVTPNPSRKKRTTRAKR